MLEDEHYDHGDDGEETYEHLGPMLVSGSRGVKQGKWGVWGEGARGCKAGDRACCVFTASGPYSGADTCDCVLLVCLLQLEAGCCADEDEAREACRQLAAKLGETWQQQQQQLAVIVALVCSANCRWHAAKVAATCGLQSTSGSSRSSSSHRAAHGCC